ncbi:hypothetical protein BDV59DRAFT_182611 [Aspergillus ambiguus]|uniref:uncharacterized protein n=1 Tax=Aspergillus ambiguus TaxID=176160 RepID=UPI003CCDF89F
MVTQPSLYFLAGSILVVGIRCLQIFGISLFFLQCPWSFISIGQLSPVTHCTSFLNQQSNNEYDHTGAGLGLPVDVRRT